MAFARRCDFRAECSKVVGLTCALPFDAETRAMAQFAVQDEHRAAIAVKERVAIGEQPHHFARPLPQHRFVLPNPQPLLHRPPGIERVAEQGIALAYGHVGGCGRSILSGPRVER